MPKVSRISVCSFMGAMNQATACIRAARRVSEHDDLRYRYLLLRRAREYIQQQLDMARESEGTL